MGRGILLSGGSDDADLPLPRPRPRPRPTTKKTLEPMAAIESIPATIRKNTMLRTHSSLVSLMVMYCTVPALPEFQSGGRRYSRRYVTLK